MKKAKISLILIGLIFCFAFFGGCAIYPSSIINDWNFAPQQASGTEIDLSLISGSELSFDFTIQNGSNARPLNASSFMVVFSKGESEENASIVYFDDYKSSLNFARYETKNIKLHAMSTSTISENSSITIKYDGRTIVTYIVK